MSCPSCGGSVAVRLCGDPEVPGSCDDVFHGRGTSWAKGRDDYGYTFLTSCIGVSQDDVPDLDKMIDDGESMTHDEFKLALGWKMLDEWAVGQQYDLDPEEGLTLAQDWHVTYQRSEWKGTPCLFLQWSGIEFIWLKTGE